MEMVERALEEFDGREALVYLPVSELFPHPDNPRKELGDLTELAESIKSKGIMQNLTVVRGHSLTHEEWKALSKAYDENPSEELRVRMNAKKSEDGYTVIIGHRRCAAAKLAGLNEVPCVIVEMSAQEQIGTMLLENMQRSDLTLYEQAQGLQMMMDFGDSIEQVAEKSGLSQSTVRRRVKLLELDEKKFKESSERGATLADYMELDKVKDPKTRDGLLSVIGTDNFKYQLRQAIDTERRAEKFAQYLAVIQSFATETSNVTGLKYVAGYNGYCGGEVEVPEDADTVKYFYSKSSGYVSIYRERDDEEKTDADDRERERLAQRERVAKMEEVRERAYDLRWEFARDVSETTVKKFLTEIIAFWIYLEGDNSGYVDESDVYDILDLNDGEDNLTYEQVLGVVAADPMHKMWSMALLYMDDDNRAGYFNWQGDFVDNGRLNAYYDLLVKMGYAMSDEEKQMRDGTHPLFVKEETE
jgi:ParB family chromosome partitioning protein